MRPRAVRSAAGRCRASAWSPRRCSLIRARPMIRCDRVISGKNRLTSQVADSKVRAAVENDRKIAGTALKTDPRTNRLEDGEGHVKAGRVGPTGRSEDIGRSRAPDHRSNPQGPVVSQPGFLDPAWRSGFADPKPLWFKPLWFGGRPLEAELFRNSRSDSHRLP